MQTAIQDNSPILEKVGNNLVWSIVDMALFIGCFIDMTLLVAYNEIAIQQTDATIAILNIYTWLLDYISIYPNPSIIFKSLDIVLWISLDSSY